MSTTLKPTRDLGPEFTRRLDSEVQRFTRRMFVIGRGADRFSRADQIQAECDRLLAEEASQCSR